MPARSRSSSSRRSEESGQTGSTAANCSSPRRHSPWCRASRWQPLSFVLIAVTGFGLILTANATLQILQTIVDDAMRERVMNFFGMAFLGMAPLGSLAAGALAASIGPAHTLAMGGVFCVLCAAYRKRRLPALREDMRSIYARLGIGRPVAT